jgi:hypothetical protein
MTAKGLVGERIVSLSFSGSGREFLLRLRFSTNTTLQVKHVGATDNTDLNPDFKSVLSVATHRITTIVPSGI